MHYHLKDLKIPAMVGVYESEKGAPQNLLINVYFEYDAQKASVSDDLADTVDYALVAAQIKSICLAEHYNLLEKLQIELHTKITAEFPSINNLSITIEKYPFKHGSVVVKA